MQRKDRWPFGDAIKNYRDNPGLLQIASALLIHIPRQLNHGQKNILLAPPGCNRRVHNSAHKRQQLALAFGQQIDVAVPSRRTFEINSHRWRSPAINDLLKRMSLQF